MESHEPWHASIIHTPTAPLLATKINPKWPPLRPDEELMFPEGHVRPKHRVVAKSLSGSRVRTQYTLLTPLILDYCPSDWRWVSHADLNKRAHYCVSRLSCHRRYWDWKQLVTTKGWAHSSFLTEFPGQRHRIWSNHCNSDTSGMIHIIIVEAHIQSGNNPASYCKNF